MRLDLTDRFQQDVRTLAPEQRAAVFEALLGLSGILGQPHLHAGAGLRKIHPRGIFEVRVGLGLRLVFGLEAGVAVFHRAGTHDEIRRYLRSL